MCSRMFPGVHLPFAKTHVCVTCQVTMRDTCCGRDTEQANSPRMWLQASCIVFSPAEIISHQPDGDCITVAVSQFFPVVEGGMVLNRSWWTGLWFPTTPPLKNHHNLGPCLSEARQWLNFASSFKSILGFDELTHASQSHSLHLYARGPGLNEIRHTMSFRIRTAPFMGLIF